MAWKLEYIWQKVKKLFEEKSGLTVKRLGSLDKRNRNISGKVENKSVCYGMKRQLLDRFTYIVHAGTVITPIRAGGGGGGGRGRAKSGPKC